MSDEERRALYRRALAAPEESQLVASGGFCAPLGTYVVFDVASLPISAGDQLTWASQGENGYLTVSRIAKAFDVPPRLITGDPPA